MSNNNEEDDSELADELFISEDLSAEDYEELQMHCMLEAELKDSDDFLNGIMTDLKSAKKSSRSKTKTQAKRPHRLRKVKKRPSPLKWLLPACACLIGGFFLINHLQKANSRGTLVLNSGAEVKIKQGSKYKILGDNSLELESGELQATVPKKAIGFTVKTPQGKIVDLSTRFNAQTDAGKTVVQVLEGKVEVFRNKESLVMYEGESSTLSNEQDKPLIQSSLPKAEGLVINLNFGNVSAGGSLGLFDGHWNNSNNYPESKMHNSLKQPVEMDLALSDESSYQLKKTSKSMILDGCLFTNWQLGPKPPALEIELTKIPFKKYDIYVFYAHDEKGHVFDLSIGEESYEIHSSGETDEEFKRWRGPTPGKSGSYQAFTGLSGKNQIIRAALDKSHQGTHSWFISAIQIVEKKN